MNIFSLHWRNLLFEAELKYFDHFYTNFNIEGQLIKIQNGRIWGKNIPKYCFEKNIFLYLKRTNFLGLEGKKCEIQNEPSSDRQTRGDQNIEIWLFWYMGNQHQKNF